MNLFAPAPTPQPLTTTLPMIPPPPVFSFKKVNGQLVKIPFKDDINNSNNGDNNNDSYSVKSKENLFESYWESEYPRLGESCQTCTKSCNNGVDGNNLDNNDYDNNDSSNNNDYNNDKKKFCGFNAWMNNYQPSDGWKTTPKKDQFTSILLSSIIQSYNETEGDSITNLDESHAIISRYFGKNENFSDDEGNKNDVINNRKMLIENLKKKYDEKESVGSDDDSSNDNYDTKIDHGGVEEELNMKITEWIDEERKGGDGKGVKEENEEIVRKIGRDREVEVVDNSRGGEEKGRDREMDEGKRNAIDIEEECGADDRCVLTNNKMEVIEMKIEKERRVEKNDKKAKLKSNSVNAKDEEGDMTISETSSNHSQSDNESEKENSSQQSKELKTRKTTGTKESANSGILKEKTVNVDDENSNYVYSRIHGYRILVPDTNDSKAFYKKILGGLKEVRVQIE